MSLVITGDECWVYGYDPETKQMSSQWSTSPSPRPKKARQVKSNIKTTLIAFFDIDGLVHHEFVPTGQTVNNEFYGTVLQRLRDAVRRHRPEKRRSGNWILHHDNASAHRAVTINEFLAKHNIGNRITNLTVGARLRSHARPRGTCRGPSVTGTSSSVRMYVLTNAPYSVLRSSPSLNDASK